MRGLTDEGPPSAYRASQAAITALAVLAALGLFMAACGTGGTGARDEGPAKGNSVAGAGVAASPSARPSEAYKPVDAVSLLRHDPEVSPEVKRYLTPCGDAYPVDVSYGDLTGGTSKDLVVNVLTCADAVGVGSYVYRKVQGRYENVFKTEESPVYAEIDRSSLVVTQQVYDKGDPVSDPSGENVITFGWAKDHFVRETYRHTDYGNADGGLPAPTPVPTPVPTRP
ncbi:hypothetical protein [Streptomyces sp. NPDC086787]|uniref:hypothetical protein n=1 Tax=Streptomyces sp. NPDC086787 TaxID=3365759 RepID=UPI0038150DA7